LLDAGNPTNPMLTIVIKMIIIIIININ